MNPSSQEEDLKKIGETVTKMKEDMDNLQEALEQLRPAQQEIIKLLKAIEDKV
jgi:predicted RNase H-like nuclease (RuvC/YqgF family)